MDESDLAAAAGLNLTSPSTARIYDYFLGGSHNFEADRAVAHQIIDARPDVPILAQSNRAFLRRAVRFIVAHGVNQLIDIGSGIPTAGNVHEIAQTVQPNARVVYVDCDPVAVTYSRIILGDHPNCAVVHADLRNPDEILDSPEVATLIDFSEPVGILLFAVLHGIPDTDDPAGIVVRLTSRAVPGSYLALSHGTTDPDPERAARIAEQYRKTPTPAAIRSPHEVAGLFGRFDLVAPGLVELSQWRPEGRPMIEAGHEHVHGGVARLR